ncbi:uncharacterized protein L201_003679 [Kwoniella dendrophila CBS 6074]|uniref:Transcription elongation factor Eaf N-terminal domain-containing protein n=1 Tax=Kwoniella dendrophila CBS 6074 TaxID=1295534 RepID=A0AAX4JTK8_9TREE
MSEIPQGTYPLQFSSSINSQWGIGGPSKKRRRDEEELVAFRYAFKPASITQNTPGTYNISAGIGNNGQVVFDTNTGIQQSFDVREEHSKARECVLIYNEVTKSFTLHTLPSTLHLTLNRSTSSRAKAASVTSSTSSKSIPLSKLSRDIEDDELDDSGSRLKEENEEETTPRPKKKSRPSVVDDGIETRPTKGGKGLPRKKPLESAPIPILSTTSTTSFGPKTKGVKAKAGKANTKSTTTKGKGKKSTVAATQEHDTSTKFKSSEFIEDSDEEIANSESNIPEEEAEEEIDEFANLLGESLAQADNYDDNDEESEEEEEEDDDDGGLGGARLVVGSSVAPVIDDDGSEWI